MSENFTIQRIKCRNNEAWRRERANSIGASSVPAILGVSPFVSPRQVRDRMLAELSGEFDYSQSWAMMRGHAYEQGVADMFAWSTGHQLIASSGCDYLVRRSDIPFMHASPDRIYWLDANGPKHGKMSESNKGVLECKTTRRSVDPDNIPVYWVLQLQVQMGITGYHMGTIAWDQLHKTEGFGYMIMEFNQEMFDAIVEVCRHFWEQSVLKGNEPLSASELKTKYPILYRDAKPVRHIKQRFSLFEAAKKILCKVNFHEDAPEDKSPQRIMPAGTWADPDVPKDSALELGAPEDSEDRYQKWLERIWR